MITQLGMNAKKASALLNKMGTNAKNRGLSAAAESLVQNTAKILAENEHDIANARRDGMKEVMVDRLRLTEERIKAMADGLLDVVALEDPIGEVLSMKTRPNGLMIGQKRVPFGVVGIIYESRPNVTADAFGLCFKSGNAVILRGGSDAIFSNTAIVAVIREALAKENLPEDAIALVTDTSRETALQLMQMREYIDVLIPRGGAGLIRSVIENSKIPVIETGTGNCHVYVDEFADLDMAIKIIVNAKTQRPSVCNACESILVHKVVASAFIPRLAQTLQEHGVEMRGDETVRNIDSRIMPAEEADWGSEYLDLIVSIKTVFSVDEAIAHINRYNTGHSETIVTKDYARAQKFLNEVDAAAVYVNASTRFTDGFEFGFGAEIGISTQKLHARGPMGLKELTSTKYIIYGDGQIR